MKEKRSASDLIIDHLKIIKSKYPLLLREEEHNLIAAFQEPLFALEAQLRTRIEQEDKETAKHYKDKIRDLAKSLLLNPSTSFYNKKAREAQDLLLMSNIGLILKEVRKASLRAKILEDYDLFIAGVHGLFRALYKFDLTRKNNDGKSLKFSTYATGWVRQFIQRSMQDSDRLIRIPIHIHDQLNRLNKKYAEYTETNYDEAPPDSKTLATLLGISEEMAAALGRHRFPIESIDKECDNEEDTLPTDFLEADEIKYNVDGENLERAFNKENLLKLIALLDPEDRKFLQLKYALADGIDRNKRELASIYAMKPKEIDEWEKQIIEKLRLLANRDDFSL